MQPKSRQMQDHGTVETSVFSYPSSRALSSHQKYALRLLTPSPTRQDATNECPVGHSMLARRLQPFALT